MRLLSGISIDSPPADKTANGGTQPRLGQASPTRPSASASASAPAQAFRRPALHVLVSLLFFLALAGCGQGPASSPFGGGCDPSVSKFLRQDPHVAGRITYCTEGDASIAKIEAATYPAGTTTIAPMISGFPATPGVELRAVPVQGGGAPVLLNVANVGDTWKRVVIEIPQSLQASAFRVELVDSATAGFGWAGIGVDTRKIGSLLVAGAGPLLLGVLAAHAWLLLAGLALPGRPDSCTRAIAAVLALGLASLLAVSAYVATPTLGAIVAYCLLLLPLAGTAVRQLRGESPAGDLRDLNRLLVPSLALTLLLLWIGLYPFQWDGTDGSVPAARWRNMPIDSWLPLIFSEMLLRGHLNVPMVGDWLSSDRPPLQSGLYLLFHQSWLQRPGLLYQAISTWAQALVLIPLNVYLSRFVRPVQRGVILFMVATSALVLVNGLFVWPKLLAAAFCAIYHLALFQTGDDSRRTWKMAGIAAALAMLSHGGSLFVLVGSTGAFLLLRKPAAFVLLVKTGATAVLLYLPWIGYQRLMDPPGDRLLKWHFAGRIAPTDSSVWQTLVDAYSQLTLYEWLDIKRSNFGTLVYDIFDFPRHAAQLLVDPGSKTISRIVETSFFYTSYSMWFASPLLLLPCWLWARWRGKRGETAPAPYDMLIACLLSLFVWAMLMFEPATTIIHQGSYLSVLSLFLVTLIVMAQSSSALLYAAAALNTAVAVVAYVFDRPSILLPSPSLYNCIAIALSSSLLLACLCAVPRARPRLTPT